MRKFLKWTLWIIAFVLIVFFGVIVAGTKYAKRVAPWPDPVPGISLTPSRPFLAASNIGPDNAYFYFLQLTKFADSLRWNDTIGQEEINLGTHGWVAGAATNLDAWIATNRVVFDLFAKAATMTNSQAWTMVDFYEWAPELWPVLKMFSLYAIEANKAFLEGRSTDGVSDTQTIIRNAANVEKGHWQEGAGIANAGDRYAMGLVRRMIAAGKIDADSSLRLAALFEWRDANCEPPAEAFKTEMRPALNFLEEIRSGISNPFDGGPPDFRIKLLRLGLPLLGSSREQTEAHIRALYSNVVWADGDPGRIILLRTRIEEPLRDAPVPTPFFDDPLGRFFCRDKPISFSSFLEDGITLHSELRLMQVLLAVERWRMDHADKPPAAAEDLVPKYLAKIPEDPFAKGSNLLYRVDADSYMVYSVGMDGVDNGGDVEDFPLRDVGWRVKLDRKAGAKREE